MSDIQVRVIYRGEIPARTRNDFETAEAADEWAAQEFQRDENVQAISVYEGNRLYARYSRNLRPRRLPPVD